MGPDGPSPIIQGSNIVSLSLLILVFAETLRLGLLLSPWDISRVVTFSLALAIAVAIMARRPFKLSLWQGIGAAILVVILFVLHGVVITLKEMGAL